MNNKKRKVNKAAIKNYFDPFLFFSSLIKLYIYYTEFIRICQVFYNIYNNKNIKKSEVCHYSQTPQIHDQNDFLLLKYNFFDNWNKSKIKTIYNTKI